MLRTSPVSFVLLLLHCVLSICPSTFAQVYRPSEPAYLYSTFVEGRAFYIGDRPTDIPDKTSDYTQNFAIDLSVSWNATDPRYIPLPPADPVTGESTISSDGKFWVLGSAQSVQTYDFEAATWKTIINTPKLQTGNAGGAMTDPQTGLIYILILSKQPYMLTLDLTTKAYNPTVAPGSFRNVTEIKCAWTTRKILCYAHFDMPVGFRLDLYSYDTADGSWKDLTKEMKGQIPPPRNGFCFVPAYSGTKLAFFSGYGGAVNTLMVNDIFELDVATLTWTKGTDAAEGRYDAACGVSGDYFMSWGGRHLGDKAIKDADMTLVYNMKTKRWTNAFVAALAPAPATTATTQQAATKSFHNPSRTSTSMEDAESSTNRSPRASVIIAPILIVVVLALGTGILLRYRSRRRLSQDKNSTHDFENSLNHESAPMEAPVIDGSASHLTPSHAKNNHRNPNLTPPGPHGNKTEINDPDLDHRNLHIRPLSPHDSKAEISDGEINDLISPTAYPANTHTSANIRSDAP
ncbi:hypothetical protein B0O80DRAFT_424897 [Mortierella sp. GBAus27b]|nr:hypothetical protein BGX31_000644 [Mortierella sp. GBA43]KAI8356947.1 hypothetical protein B0O80DRAFT_424897 [Mortierella sp. GBAus27b]